MPAVRGPRLRSAPGSGTSLVSDLYIDDAGVIAMASPHARAPCKRRMEAAAGALRDAGRSPTMDFAGSTPSKRAP